MPIEQKVKRYYELKEELKEYRKRPIGDKIKPGGHLEKSIKEKFIKKRAEKILTRSEGFSKDDFDRWDKMRTEYEALCEELEEMGILIYDDEGDERILEYAKRRARLD